MANTCTRYLAPDELQRHSFTLIRDDLGVGSAVALEDAKDHGLGARPSAALTSNPSPAKVGLIDFDCAYKRAMTLALLGQSDPDFEIDCIGRADAEVGQHSAFLWLTNPRRNNESVAEKSFR